MGYRLAEYTILNDICRSYDHTWTESTANPPCFFVQKQQAAIAIRERFHVIFSAVIIGCLVNIIFVI